MSYKDSSLQTCSTMQIVKSYQHFQGSWCIHLPIWEYTLISLPQLLILDCLTPKMKALWCLNGGNYLPIAVVQYPSRLESSGTTLPSQAQQNHSVNDKMKELMPNIEIYSITYKILKNFKILGYKLRITLARTNLNSAIAKAVTKSILSLHYTHHRPTWM